MTNTSTLPRVLSLDSPVRRYDWGSIEVLPRLLGLPVDGRPVAELWIGAHPDDPARWTGSPDRPGLDGLIAASPAALLGERVSAEFENRLPFLVKLLTADRALSIQVHPDRARARARFAAEDAAGIPRTAAERNYKDDNHKPELLCAVTPFEALCGIRPLDATVRFFAELVEAGAPALRPWSELLVDGAVADVCAGVLRLAEADRVPLAEQTAGAMRTLAGSGSEFAENAAACARIAEDFPGDMGLVVAALLNYVRLAPAEAIFLGAGTLHAYLAGFGVEVMANSDNVLRGGLTGKHIDVDELLAVTSFAPMTDPRAERIDIAPGAWRYPVPVPDFQVARWTAAAGELLLDPMVGHVLVSIDGSVSVDGVSEPVGHGLFVLPGAEPVRARTSGEAYVATVGGANPPGVSREI